MKRITASLIIACLLLGAHAFGQQITFSNKRATLSDIRKALEKQTGYTIISNSKVSPLIKPVSIHVKDASIQDFLNAFFRNQPYTFEIFGKMVTLVPRERDVIASSRLVTIKGKILNEQGEPIPAATVAVNGSNKVVVTNDYGEFLLNGVDTMFNIVITSVNYEPQEIDWQGEEELDIRLKHRVSELNIVSVVSDGYQKQTKEKVTGSYAKIDNELLNRRVSTNIIDRLEGITSGLVFNSNINPGTNQSSITIRSRSTILANANPLIVLDNFPYTGDINNINPNDVESITVLKDADAASIWGAFSGNGVIVITTKKGKYQSPLKVSLNSNVTVGAKPDLWYQKRLSSSSYIDLEKEMFERGVYFTRETDHERPVLSRVVEILIDQRDNKISASEANAKLDALKTKDIRSDWDKYFLRRSVNQQYAINASGGGTNNHYYFSAGFDKNIASMKANQFDRITLSANNTFSWLKKRLEFNTGVIFTESNSDINSHGAFTVVYPYESLADAYGNAVTVPYGFRQPYKDTAGKTILEDWDYRPLDELKYYDNPIKNSDYRINTDIKLKVVKGLELTAFYQYNRGYIEQENYRSPQSYYVRDMINLFTTVDAGQIVRGVPAGGILDQIQTNYEAHNFRTQLNFNKNWSNRSSTVTHTINSIAGTEVRTLNSERDVSRLYGYNRELQTSSSVKYDDYFYKWDDLRDGSTIPKLERTTSTADNFLSYYLNTKYILQKKYILSLNFRKDESNLFGVNTNQKGVPLWSAGASWEISQEKFYRAGWLPYLKLRVSNGYNGNVDRTVYALTTAVQNQENTWNLPSGDIINPPNPNLRWEKNRMINLGLDFSTRNATVEGSVEYYLRKGTDLIGENQLDPTTGSTFFKGNTADMKGRGVDVLLRTRNLNKQLKWQSTILFSYATDEVTNYKLERSAIWYYSDPQYISPVEGKPVYSFFSFKSMGLESSTGKEFFSLNGSRSDDYDALNKATDLDNLEYSGPANPTIFGSLRNTFSWKQFELSWNITWKLGHYFRRGTIHYSNFASGLSIGHPDYESRWQKPGDEALTKVPAFLFPLDATRDGIYAYSSRLIEKGDHFRLQDIRLSYELSRAKIPSLPMQSLVVYVYCNNLGLIWTANKQGIDPDYVTGQPNPRTISVGFKTDL